MKNIIILSLCIILFLQTARLIIGREPEEDLKSIIDSLGNQAEQCFLSGDIDAMLQFYCDDIISMPNSHPMVKGKHDLKLKTEAILAMGLKFQSLESTTIEVQSGGDIVYEIGTFRQAIIMPGTREPLEQNGKYVNIWKRQPDGKLKIAVEIYNSDAEPNAAKTE